MIRVLAILDLWQEERGGGSCNIAPPRENKRTKKPGRSRVKKKKLKKLETPLLEQHYSEKITKSDKNKTLKLPHNELRNIK